MKKLKFPSENTLMIDIVVKVNKSMIKKVRPLKINRRGTMFKVFNGQRNVIPMTVQD